MSFFTSRHLFDIILIIPIASPVCLPNGSSPMCWSILYSSLWLRILAITFPLCYKRLHFSHAVSSGGRSL
uniref:Putative secreted protein n=1 Tax=Xenopsylla cheopis TaxID=163159 RepID=A0A6M2E0J2_XENCH